MLQLPEQGREIQFQWPPLQVLYKTQKGAVRINMALNEQK